MSAPMRDAILAVKAGSSSLKFALYPAHDGLVDAARISGNIEGLEAGGTRAIRAAGSPVEIWVVPTDEGRVAAADAVRLLAAANEVRLRAA